MVEDPYFQKQAAQKCLLYSLLIVAGNIASLLVLQLEISER